MSSQPISSLSQDRFNFIHMMFQAGAIKFGSVDVEEHQIVDGDFSVGSGRYTPYDFFSKVLLPASLINAIGERLAREVKRLEIPDDFVIVTPQNSFCHLAVATVLYYSKKYSQNIAFGGVIDAVKDKEEEGISFNLFKGKHVVVVTDRTISGDSVNKAISYLKSQEALLGGVVLLIDRMEFISSDIQLSFSQSLRLRNIKVRSALTQIDLEEFLSDDRFDSSEKNEQLKPVQLYRSIWGEKLDLSKGNRSSSKSVSVRNLSIDTEMIN